MNFMCFLCDADNNLFVPLNESTIEYSGIEIAINKQGMLRSRYFNDDGCMISQDIVNLRYCPYCGRQLNKNKIYNLER